jgi:Zn-finger nucleic acid-binding protein
LGGDFHSGIGIHRSPESAIFSTALGPDPQPGSHPGHAGAMSSGYFFASGLPQWVIPHQGSVRLYSGQDSAHILRIHARNIAQIANPKMNCPTCSTPMEFKTNTGKFQCARCQPVQEKDEEGVHITGEASNQSCPICKIPLSNAAIAAYSIFYCTTCRGMLIPMNEFQALVDELHGAQQEAVIQTPADSKDLRRAVQCPHCHKRMDTHYYGGPGNVVMDSCDACSVNWLDRGELMRIVHAPGEHRSATPFGATMTYFDEASDYNLGTSTSTLGWNNSSGGAGLLGTIAFLLLK